jgi:hypothetical protein
MARPGVALAHWVIECRGSILEAKAKVLGEYRLADSDAGATGRRQEPIHIAGRMMLVSKAMAASTGATGS